MTVELVSVVIPSYRQPRFVRRAIESARLQSYANVEVIVVDDDSRDRSIATAAEEVWRDPRVRLLRCHHNGGLGRARNVGLAAARGTYCLFLDSDDYLLPGALAALVDAAASGGPGATSRRRPTTAWS